MLGLYRMKRSKGRTNVEKHDDHRTKREEEERLTIDNNKNNTQSHIRFRSEFLSLLQKKI